MPQLIDAIVCPICLSPCKLSFTIADEQKTDWIFCNCRCIFHMNKVDKSIFDEEYHKKVLDFKALPERCEYLMRQYLPIVRELTYGRKFLDVGYGFDYHLVNLKKDGWITNGIDLLNHGYICDDFETHDFKANRFDFILMSRVLECFHNPIKALYKAKELLAINGVLLIITPDSELVYERGMFEFGNWNPTDKSVIFSELQLKKVLETLGFKVILSRKDTERRGLGWNHVHVMVQNIK